MRASRERGEHETENASSCSGPNGETEFKIKKYHVTSIRPSGIYGHKIERCAEWSGDDCLLIDHDWLAPVENLFLLATKSKKRIFLYEQKSARKPTKRKNQK